ncbi:glycosyltransferase family 4 protein [Streptococcus hillyeri]|uniref:Glycosyltransferase n=1 Tax=Streptococcus hillyeri TaxID=2282420 RepID=A0A3L9DX59_9STRE|nr:glycosyltransferase family 4 protein [Streptococcus hillyeri]RLY04487.1 glycosyltransferase [Streptococcus hillyeri]
MSEKSLRVNMLSSSEKVAGQGVSGAYRELLRLLKREAQKELIITENQFVQADITHYHTIDPLFYLSTFFKKRVGRRVGYVHFLPETLEGSLKMPRLFQKVLGKYVTSFYNRMDHLVVVNPTFIDDLVAFGIARDKISYIPNFVNKEKWYPSTVEKRQSTRREFGIKDDDFVVLGAGQVQKRKGIDDFVTLAEQLPHITFIWAGGFSFGGITDGYDQYKKIMENPPTNVIFTGIVEADKMRDLYAATDVFLLPSYNELFPMTILEAASCGAPIVLRDLELYKVILEGSYAAAKDVSSMKNIIDDLSRNSTALSRLKEKSGQISVNYSEEKLLQVWIDFYQNQAKVK